MAWVRVSALAGLLRGDHWPGFSVSTVAGLLYYMEYELRSEFSSFCIFNIVHNDKLWAAVEA